MLARHIRSVERHAHHARHARRVDNRPAVAPAAPGLHGWQLRAQAIEHAFAVHIHDEIELLVGEVPDGTFWARDAFADHAGHVGGAGDGLLEVGCGSADPLGDGSGGADVDDRGEDLGWLCSEIDVSIKVVFLADRDGAGREGGGVDVGERKKSAVGGKEVGDAETYA